MQEADTLGADGGTRLDLVFAGARVIDPESGLDAVRDVGVNGARIAAVSPEPLAGRVRVDARGLVVAPGFIDLHSHAQSIVGHRLHALDGVTTALDLEAGRYDVDRDLRRAGDEGRPLNFGYSAGWAAARTALSGGSEAEIELLVPSRPGWDEPWDERRVGRLGEMLAERLGQGAIGIGVLLGYAPGVTRAEYLALARLAYEHRVPTFTHTRYISVVEPGSSLEGMLEVVAAAAGSGAHMHVCHVQSTSNRQYDEVAEVFEHAQAAGVRITTEAYPYGTGATSIGAAFLHPDHLHRMGLTPQRITLVRTGRALRDHDELRRLREANPNDPVFITWADETIEEDRQLLQRSLLFADTAIASDSGTPIRGAKSVDEHEWPLADGALTHPRSAGCYAKVFRWLVRELGVLSLPEAVRRCSLVPADILAEAVPAMRRKGRVQVGCDADLVVFDPETFSDRATYDAVEPSVGVRHLLVNGEFVVRDGAVRTDAYPGQAVRGGAA